MAQNPDDVSRAKVAIRRGFVAFTVTAVVAAGIVSWLTAALPTAIAPIASVTATPVEPGECFTDNAAPNCRLERPTSPAFPDADAVFILEPGEDTAEDVYRGYRIPSYPILVTYSSITPDPFEYVITPGLDAKRLDGTVLRAGASLPTTTRRHEEATSSRPQYAAWTFADLPIWADVIDAMRTDGGVSVSLTLNYEIEEFAPASFRTPAGFEVIVTEEQVPIEMVPIDILDQQFAVAPVSQPRQVGLFPIWGIASLVVGLMWVMGLTMARPLLGIAARSTDRASEAESQRMRAEELRRQVIEVEVRERRAIAQELHDSALQRLSAVTLRLGLFERSVDEDQRPALEAIETNVRETIVDLRSIVHHLTSEMVDGDSIMGALQHHLDSIDYPGDAEIHLVDRSENPPSGEVSDTAFMIAREALMNAVLHSDASTILVDIRDEQSGYVVEVTDDGTGFDPDVAVGRDGHLGLRTLFERASAIGGSCTITSSPGKGTTVHFTVPPASREEQRQGPPIP